MRRAVNVADLQAAKMSPESSGWGDMLAAVCSRKVVDAEPGRFDGSAVLVEGSVTEERWASVYDLVRNGAGRRKGLGKNALRIYEERGTSWRRV